MGSTSYQISEASRRLHVEAHVLRYWEEELGINIPRNEMGHREYSEKHIQVFRKILDMKEEGYQLRAIRAALKKDLEELKKLGEEKPLALKEESKIECTKEERFEQFHTLMNQIMMQALESNNEALIHKFERMIGRQMSETMNQVMSMQEQREEERFRKLDELLRAYQSNNRARSEAALTRSPIIPLKKNKKNRFFRKRSI